MHLAVYTVGNRTHPFGHGGERQIGAHGNRGRIAKTQGQQRRHQRASADARYPYKQSDHKAAGNLISIHAWHDKDKTAGRSEEHTSELQSLLRISYAVFCLIKKNKGMNTI